MNLEAIKNELDNGGRFMGVYKDINELVKYLENTNLPYNFIHAKLIEIFKINDNYLCVKEGIKRKEVE